MAGASIRAVCDFSALNEAASDEDVSSIISVPTDTGTRGVSGDSNMAADKGSGGKSTKGKEKSSSTTASLRKSAKFSDLDKLESKIVDQMTSKFESMDGKFDKLFSMFSIEPVQRSDSVLRRSETNVDSGTSGARRPQITATERNDTSGVRVSIPLDDGLNRELLGNQVLADSDHDDGLDMVSLQPGQTERRTLGLLSSDGSDRQSIVSECEQGDNSCFGKYTDTSGAELSRANLGEVFGQDAHTENKSSNGLSLDETQINIIKDSWRCKLPDKVTAYKDSYRQSFPVQSDSETERLLQVPSLDELSERLLIRKHGRKAAFGNTQTLFSQPFKSIEKVAYQGQVAARMGIISTCYAQQALSALLQNLKSESPNMDEAIQNVRDIFAISTKTLDQFCKTGAFHHLVRRRATVADTGLHEFKDLQKAALTAPLSGDGIFGEEFEKKLKNRQEKDKQLSDLMPEMNKKPFTKRKSTFQSDSSASKKARNSEDSYNKPFRSGSNYGSNYKKPFRGAQSSDYRNNTSRSNSVSGFRSQGGTSNRS